MELDELLGEAISVATVVKTQETAGRQIAAYLPDQTAFVRHVVRYLQSTCKCGWVGDKELMSVAEEREYVHRNGRVWKACLVAPLKLAPDSVMIVGQLKHQVCPNCRPDLDGLPQVEINGVWGG